jgi:hypothetical protein
MRAGTSSATRVTECVDKICRFEGVVTKREDTCTDEGQCRDIPSLLLMIQSQDISRQMTSRTPER